jgi:hypothetical protein
MSKLRLSLCASSCKNRALVQRYRQWPCSLQEHCKSHYLTPGCSLWNLNNSALMKWHRQGLVSFKATLKFCLRPVPWLNCHSIAQTRVINAS